MTGRFECETHEALTPQLAEVHRVVPRGVLDLDAVATLRQVLLKSIAAQPTAVIVDLTGLTVDDPVMLTVFSAMTRQAEANQGCQLILCGANPEMSTAIDSAGLGRRLTVCPTWDDALGRCGTYPPSQRYQATYLPRLTSVAAARTMATKACQAWAIPAAVIDRVRVVVTELTANAIRHAGTQIEVTLRLGQHYLFVAVRDRDSRPPVLKPVTAEGGRGLLLVDAITVAWGSRPTPDGKVTWATVRRS